MSARVWAVVRREYLERVRSKAFVIGTVVGPVLMAGLMLGPGLIMARQRGKLMKVAVLDASGTLQKELEAGIAEKKAAQSGERRFQVVPRPPGDLESARAVLRQRVLAREIDGYLLVPEDVLTRSVAEYYGRNVSSVMDLRLLDQAVEQVLTTRRLTQEGLEEARVKDLMRSVDLKTMRLSEKGETEDRGATFFFSVTLMMILYVSVLMWGQAVMQGVIEEKANRVVEVAVSSLSPTELFAGKLIGVGSAGLTQFVAWAATMAVLSVFGGGALAAVAGAQMPDVSPLVLVSFVLCFLLGYFLYAALYAAVGAAVNTLQEAQSLAFPVMAPLISAMLFFPMVLQNPDSPMSVALSLVPPLTPLLMFLRITALTPPAWQLVLALVLMLVAIAFVAWAAARVYRVGILMYGKRPTFPEIVRWVRHA